jgi:hypothetical protein
MATEFPRTSRELRKWFILTDATAVAPLDVILRSLARADELGAESVIEPALNALADLRTLLNLPVHPAELYKAADKLVGGPL